MRDGLNRDFPRWVRVGWIVLVLATCLRVWLGPFEFDAVAHAQIPDGGAQRKQQIDELKSINQQLAEIKQILKSGTIQVRVQGGDAALNPPASKASGNP